MLHIYHLVDPETRAVRYVGMTARPSARLAAHIAESRKRQNTEKKAWIKELTDKGLKPVMAIVGTAENEIRGRMIESDECHRHKDTIFNMHDPRKGAKDIRKGINGQKA